MEFSSKADTLCALEGKLASAKVLPQFCFTAMQWQQQQKAVLAKFENDCAWHSTSLVVRSSGIAEDCEQESLAGHFESILNVEGRESLLQAVSKVINSFGQLTPADQVFIQPMLANVARSGVVFTKDPSTQSPYYVINYATSGNTESVTSGYQNESLLYVAKGHHCDTHPLWVRKLVALSEELETLLSRQALDIEFAYTTDHELVLFQVRPLILSADLSSISLDEHQRILARLHKTITRLNKPHPYLNGRKTVLGVMPDWNPAEIIGIRPKPLALSLYKELVTNSIWAYQRNNYGYKQLRSFPLLISLAGLPYIDVRVSLNSFIPADIPNELAEKLVNYYTQQLENAPEKHDKIEFDIVFSCFTLDIQNRLSALQKEGFSNREIDLITDSLKQLTNTIINPNGLWKKDIERIAKLPERRQTINDSDLTIGEKIYWLLEDCKRYGTLPFAGLARAGFIAVQFLRSMIADGILSVEDYANFMHSLETVSSNMSKDKANLSFSAFLEKYGHLRPGTYDILSPRYDQAPDKYFDQSNNQHTHEVNDDFPLSFKQLERLKLRLETEGIEHDVISLFHFIKGAIEGREYAKFVFTQSLSDAILLIEKLGDECHIAKEDMAYCDIAAFYKAYSSSDDIFNVLNSSIQEGKVNNKETHALILPPLITQADDIYYFDMPEGEPNFITLKQVAAATTSDLDDVRGLKNKIVFIPSADPGFDWLFSHKIAGLITKFGGANSHMAIRAGELGIPSVIGAGDVLYNKWIQAKVLDLDAANRKVVILK